MAALERESGANLEVPQVRDDRQSSAPSSIVEEKDIPLEDDKESQKHEAEEVERDGALQRIESTASASSPVVKLLFVVVALVLSVFLVSEPRRVTFQLHFLIFPLGCSRHDHRGNRHSHHYFAIQIARGCWMVRECILPHRRVFPIDLGQGVQILSPEAVLLVVHIHL